MSAQLETGLVDVALEIAERRAVSLRQLRDALVRGDNVKALSLARKVCGLTDEKSDTASKGVHRIASRR